MNNNQIKELVLIGVENMWTALFVAWEIFYMVVIPSIIVWGYVRKKFFFSWRDLLWMMIGFSVSVLPFAYIISN